MWANVRSCRLWEDMAQRMSVQDVMRDVTCWAVKFSLCMAYWPCLQD